MTYSPFAPAGLFVSRHLTLLSLSRPLLLARLLFSYSNILTLSEKTVLVSLVITRVLMLTPSTRQLRALTLFTLLLSSVLNLSHGFSRKLVSKIFSGQYLN